MAKKPIKNAIHLIFQVFCVLDYIFLVFSEHFFVMMRVLIVLTVIFGNLYKPYRGPDEYIHVLHVRLFWEPSQQDKFYTLNVIVMRLTCIPGTVWIEEAPLPITATFSEFHCSGPYSCGQAAEWTICTISSDDDVH